MNKNIYFFLMMFSKSVSIEPLCVISIILPASLPYFFTMMVGTLRML